MSRDREASPSIAAGGAPRAGEELRLVVDDLVDYAVFVVGLDGRIASWNEGARQVNGYTVQEAIGLPFAALFTPEAAARGIPDAELEEARTRGVFRGEAVCVRKDGSRYEADCTIRLLSDAAGKPRGFVKVTRDVSERKRAERAGHARADLERELLGIVSHDLRTPLNAILVGASALLRGRGLDERQRFTVERIASSAKRATRLVQDLLDFAKAQLGGLLVVHPVAFDAIDFVANVVDEIRLVYPGRQIVLEREGDGAVFWDPDRTAQLVTNLVTNGLTHGTEAGTVQVRVACEGEAVSLSVHNFGEPIPAEVLPHVFDQLTSGSETREEGISRSVGLGLYIVREIVRAHQGRIEVTSTPEGGTTFTARLPRRA